ncbi:cytochrome P450 [Mycena epipterygia]|nr:cytochrome P450 [Mycena epipterygia]
MSVPIPQPRALPFLGNVTSIDTVLPTCSFELLAKKYGEMYQLDIVGQKLIFVSSRELVNEVSDDTRFQKRPTSALVEVRNLIGDDLFMASFLKAELEEPNWGIAHRLLMPAFGTSRTIPVKGMLEEMRDISNQLLLKWERFGPEAVIDPSDDFTRVALDTIAYCSRSYRFVEPSSLDIKQPEFAVAMGDFLRESGLRENRPHVVQSMMRGTNAKYQADIKLMRELAEQIVSTRREHPIPKNDLLDKMLNSHDPQTEKAMTEESISQNLLTFLIAGMMSFMVYYLLKNPETLRKLRAQIDEVLGSRPIQNTAHRLVAAVMRETLRLSPTAPVRATSSVEDTTIGGSKYALKKGDRILLLFWEIHRDPAVWGSDAEEFRPEQMLDGKFEALPPSAWQPFGFGLRACIGRAFAWQEVCLVMASIIQKFDLSLADPSYTLQIKATLTVKPLGLYIRASPRSAGVHLYAAPSSTLMAARDSTPAPRVDVPARTSEAFAQRVANEAPSYGFRPSIGTSDSAVRKLPTDGPVVIITATFEEEPADNAVGFIDWLRNLHGNEVEVVRFAVFGCGNSDWTAAFQKIPIICDELLEKHGGSRLMARGLGDASKGEFFQMFDEFEAGLWETLSKEYSTSRSASFAQDLDVKTVDAGQERATDAHLGRVVENRVLTKDGPNLNFRKESLPERVIMWQLHNLPQNPIRDVRRVLARFGLSTEEEVILSSLDPTSLPVGKPVKLWEILSGYIELSQPATTKDLRILHDAATMDVTRAHLERLKSSYNDAVLTKRLSVFDILYPGMV